MIPMRGCGHDPLAEISKDHFDRLAPLWSCFGKAVDQLTGLDARQNWILARVAQVVGDPIDGFMRRSAEFFGGHSPYRPTIQRAGSQSLAIMTSVDLITARTVSPIFSFIASALVRVITLSIRLSPTRTTMCERISPFWIASILP